MSKDKKGKLEIVSEGKPKVAFICVYNSCRSQIAEALGKDMRDKSMEKRSPERGALLYFVFQEGKRLIKWKKKPCAKCPYKLGIVKTLINPCPECKLNGYQSYEWFRKQLSGETKRN